MDRPTLERVVGQLMADGEMKAEWLCPPDDSRRTIRCTRRRPHYGFSVFTVSSAAAAGERVRSASRYLN